MVMTGVLSVRNLASLAGTTSTSIAHTAAQRIRAFRAFAADVAAGAYLETAHQVDVDERTFGAFMAMVDKIECLHHTSQ
jgi:hypothetical protein